MLNYKMKHYGQLVRVDAIDKKYTARANQLVQHQKVPGQPHKGMKKGYATDVVKRTFRDSINATSGFY
jgi:hypothetical protein